MQKIGKYEIGATLGRGFCSKVKLAYDTEDNSEWALKIIDKEVMRQENMERYIEREISVLKKLKHQNIIQLREIMQTSRHVYLVLELAPGGDLFDRIVQANGFDEDTARTYFQQLISGLCYCHKNGFAHRDLKPENLLLDEAGNLKMTDFGLCSCSEDGYDEKENLLRTACGTPNYVAPEVLLGKGYRGDMADIWSCGVILYVMLAGCFPFDDCELNGLLRKVENGEYQRLRMVSEEASDLIAQMLIVEPQQRITVHEILNHPWFSVGWDTSMVDYNICKKEMNLRHRFPIPNTEVHVTANKVPDFAEQQGIYGKVLGNIIGTPTKTNRKTMRNRDSTLSLAAEGKCQASCNVGVSDNMNNISYNNASYSGPGRKGFQASQDRGNLENEADRENIFPLNFDATALSTRNSSVSRLHLAHTRFVFDGSMRHLVQSLEEMGAHPQQEQSMEIKGYTKGLYGRLSYTAAVSRSRAPGALAVRMRQRGGDVIGFHELYAQLMMSMRDRLRPDGEWFANGGHGTQQWKTNP